MIINIHMIIIYNFSPNQLIQYKDSKHWHFNWLYINYRSGQKRSSRKFHIAKKIR